MATAARAAKARRRRAAALAEKLYAEHRGRLLATARRNSASEEDAEEALQDALILFIDHYDPGSDSPPLAWLTLTLKRHCWALYRAQRQRAAMRREGAEERLHDPGRRPEEVVEIGEDVARVRLQLAELKPAELEALSLFALGYSYREICKITTWSYTKVNRCITEGRAALRKLQSEEKEAKRL